MTEVAALAYGLGTESSAPAHAPWRFGNHSALKLLAVRRKRFAIYIYDDWKIFGPDEYATP